VNARDKVKNSKKFSAPEDKSSAQFQSDLKAACRSLTYISETDADVIPFVSQEPATRSIASYLAALEITSKEIEEREFDNFFVRLTSEKDWHGPREKQRSMRWSKLRGVLEKSLDDIRVIRVGKIRLDIYVAGVDASGRLAGVKTKAIET
jgi:hypothetical protein